MIIHFRFVLLYDVVRHQQRFQCIPLIFTIPLTYKNNLKVFLGSTPKYLRVFLLGKT